MVKMQDAFLVYIYNAGGIVSIRRLAETFGFHVDTEFVTALVMMEVRNLLFIDDGNVILTDDGNERGAFFYDMAKKAEKTPLN